MAKVSETSCEPWKNGVKIPESYADIVMEDNGEHPLLEEPRVPKYSSEVIRRALMAWEHLEHITEFKTICDYYYKLNILEETYSEKLRNISRSAEETNEHKQSMFQPQPTFQPKVKQYQYLPHSSASQKNYQHTQITYQPTSQYSVLQTFPYFYQQYPTQNSFNPFYYNGSIAHTGYTDVEATGGVESNLQNGSACLSPDDGLGDMNMRMRDLSMVNVNSKILTKHASKEFVSVDSWSYCSSSDPELDKKI